MKKLILFLFCVLSGTFCHASSAGTNLTQLLAPIQTMQAHFSQSIWSQSGQVIHKSAGRMALERPGKFRWEVSTPLPQLIVANGHKLWIYDKDLEQLTIRPLTNGVGAEPAMLLSDASLSLDKDFYVKKISKSSGSQWFLLKPKDKNTLFAAIKLGFIQGKITEMQFEDHLGQTIIIKFTHIQINEVLSQNLFHVRVPSNVDIIDETRR
jgi:outer membrane lipoprotein carrier protein